MKSPSSAIPDTYRQIPPKNSPFDRPEPRRDRNHPAPLASRLADVQPAVGLRVDDQQPSDPHSMTEMIEITDSVKVPQAHARHS